MRLETLKIKNFRSIKCTELDLIDLDVATLIGANGSGKSNILKAIAALARDREVLSDDDFHAEESLTDEPIEIAATFAFEAKDKSLLDSESIDPEATPRFSVILRKEPRQAETIDFCSLDQVSSQSARFQKKLSELRTHISDVAPRDSALEAEISARGVNLENLSISSPDVINELDNIAAVSTSNMSIISSPIAPKIEKAIAELRDIASNQIAPRLKRIFENLDIEFLQLDSYTIENAAPIGELDNRGEHPFLFDLLRLSGKRAGDFSANGSPFLSRTKDAASLKLSRSISGVWKSHNLRFQIDRHGADLVFWVFTPQDKQISLSDLSDGEKWFLKFYVRLAIAQSERKQIIWLFDEPGRDLHTSSQIDLKAFFESISQDAQVIYTSHLAMMIPWHRLERIFAVENSLEEGTVIHRRFWKDTAFDSPLRQALSTFVGEELLSGKEHVIIEGISDFFFLQAWLRLFQKRSPVPRWAENYELFKRVLVPVDGIEKIPLYCWFLGRDVKNKTNWVVVVDSAAEADGIAKKMTDTGFGTWTRNIKSVGVLAQPKKPDILEIEALFKPSEYLDLVGMHYGSNFPDCKLPNILDVSEKMKDSGKLTKALNELLVLKNPDMKMPNGKPISLDKTGIAQTFYKLLARKEASFVSKETEARFSRLLENLDKMFDVRAVEAVDDEA